MFSSSTKKPSGHDGSPRRPPKRPAIFSRGDGGLGTLVGLPKKLGEVYATITNGPGFNSRETDRFKDYAALTDPRLTLGADYAFRTDGLQLGSNRPSLLESGLTARAIFFRPTPCFVPFISFLEQRYRVKIEPHEMIADYLDFLPDIAALIATPRE